MQLNRYNALLLATTLSVSTGAFPTTQTQKTQTAPPDNVTETYGDWVVHCATPTGPDGKTLPRVCEMSQELRQKSTNQRVLALAVQASQQSNEGGDLTVVAPFGLDLKQGIQINLGKVSLLSMAFQTCLPGGCIATGKLTRWQLNTLTKKDKATVTMTNTNGQPLHLDISLSGFSAGLKRLRSM